ncbi:spherulation-specific family 4 protein [Caldisericum exile]|uniref:Spherulation-specific family 4 n=1 Tax=Caldisericum exile (strain DSM 21853 / NBRC 104410 / AZM16c01) TaxID=511051 RepID=A0A7U6GFS5_CALEA|nr:spherulation-specific family 4 protein [Caldisericum exile]BAL81594.1 hypothetical protein CSE_14680 [Caldisericum exile AZM16c01]
MKMIIFFRKIAILLFVFLFLFFQISNTFSITPIYKKVFSNVILVPAYFGESSTEFNKLITYKSTNSTIFAIINVDNGPGSEKLDFYSLTVRRLSLSSKKVVGYVYTSYGKRNINLVKQDIDKWYSFYKNIKGIFLDETLDTTEALEYYKTLYQYIKSKYRGTVIINPGTNFTPSLINYCDYAVVFEGSPDELANFTIDNSLNKYISKLIALVYGADQNKLENIKTLLANIGLKNYYITCDTLPNPWDTFSNCMPQE